MLGVGVDTLYKLAGSGTPLQCSITLRCRAALSYDRWRAKQQRGDSRSDGACEATQVDPALAADYAKHQRPPCENKIKSLPERRRGEQDQQQGGWRSPRILLPVGYISALFLGLATRCPSHAATGGTSGSSCGPGRDRSGEFPFSLLLMHISPENSSASDERFFD